MPSAMESSLSVMEVAAQKSKLGVKTPSRAEDKKREDMEEGIAKAEREREREEQGTGEAVTVGSEAVGNDVVGKATGEEKSPFEVEGEA